MSKRVLITGGAGFIGSNLCHYLSQHRPDWKLTCLDLLTYAGNLETIAPLINKDKLSFVRGDIADLQFVRSVFSQPFDLVFNLAAESHVDRSLEDASVFVKTNVLGTQVLLDAARAADVERFVQISTDEVYGSLGPTGSFKETDNLDPSSPYSASKAASDLLALAAFKSYGLNVCVTRCTNNYGPYHFPEKLIPLFITNALEGQTLPLYGDGLNVRSWLYVEDHCRALLNVAEKGRAGEIYNIGGNQESEVSNKTITSLVLKILNKPDSLVKYVADRPGHDRRYSVDTQKINAELGWKPSVTLESGMKQTVEWFCANQSWWRNVKSGEYQRFYAVNYSASV